MDGAGNQAVCVVYIAGYGHSGSTLLDRLLGSADGVLSAGEVVTGLYDTERPFCSCGAPFMQCPFWQCVVHAAFGDDDDVVERLEEMRACLRQALRRANVLSLLFPRSGRCSSNREPRLSWLFDRLRDYYRAIADASGCDVLVDSSKSPLYALLLAQVPGIDVRLVHLVRDGRAVRYSLVRKRATRGGPVKSLARSTLAWNASNILAEVAARSRSIRHHARLRYEDLCRSPRDALARLLSLLQVDFGPQLRFFTGKDSVILEDGHLCGGNRMAMQTGEILIKSDAEWKVRLGLCKHVAISSLSWPLLLRYGYFGWWRPR